MCSGGRTLQVEHLQSAPVTLPGKAAQRAIAAVQASSLTRSLS